MATKILSREDGNLSGSTLIGSRSQEYGDIDLTFNNKPSGDIFKKSAAGAVKQAVKNLLLTNFNEKPFRPNFGGDLNNLLFELADEDIDYDVEEQIIRAVENFEPRAKILKVESNTQLDRNELKVKVTFLVKNLNEVVEFETALSRLR
jgi:phage baseplate assembly protein W